MKIPQINIKDFYLVASVLMIIVVGANIWNLTINWDLMNIAGKISFIAGSVFFQLLLFALFFGLWIATPKIGKIVEDKTLDDILKNIEGGVSNVRKEKEKT